MTTPNKLLEAAGKWLAGMGIEAYRMEMLFDWKRDKVLIRLDLVPPSELEELTSPIWQEFTLEEKK